MEKGLVIRGEIGKVVVREKTDAELELGELVIVDSNKKKILMQVFDLLYASQISEQNIELISGLQLEQKIAGEEEQEQKNFLFEPELRNYKLAVLKGLLTIEEGVPRSCKTLPAFLSPVRDIRSGDLAFITKPEHPIYMGKLRSGSKVLDVEIALPGKLMFSHHVLIAATTGKGKSNFTATMLWDATKKDYCGMLVLDPHDEYYGRNPHKMTLKDHPYKERIAYYTPKDPPFGAKTLKIHLALLAPQHFAGVVQWSDPQQQALYAYHREYGEHWIEKIIANVPLQNVQFSEGTLIVVKRRLMNLLDIEWNGTIIACKSVFDTNAGRTTVKDIVNELEQAKTVIIDTSHFKGATELLIGSIICREILERYQQYKKQNVLHMKPIISIVLEEAPRVLGKEVLEKGPNIFGTIAREGRKFHIGLCAITQLPSLIPREILANINTKIILGIEMAAERQAIIESAAQDLSDDNRTIASLDKGEAIITSNFARFATPIKIELFEEYATEESAKEKMLHGEQERLVFSGVNI